MTKDKVLNKQELEGKVELGYEFAMVARRDGLLRLESLIEE